MPFPKAKLKADSARDDRYRKGLAIRILSCRRICFQTGQIVGRRRSRCAFRVGGGRQCNYAVKTVFADRRGNRHRALGRAQYAYDKEERTIITSPSAADKVVTKFDVNTPVSTGLAAVNRWRCRPDIHARRLCICIGDIGWRIPAMVQAAAAGGKSPG